MAFIRIKVRKLKNSEVEYAYLVNNSWRKRKKMPKQKVKGYLGRIFRFDTFGEFEIGGLSYSEELVRFLEFTLFNSRFLLNDGKFVRDSVVVDLYKQAVYTGNRKCVVQINDGFLCDWSLKQLFSIKITDEKDGAILAKTLRLAGLNVTTSNFVALFQKGLDEAKSFKLPVTSPEYKNIQQNQAD